MAPASLILGMLCVQLGNAFATGVFDELGAFGAAWLRLVFAALFLAAIVRPDVRSLTRAQWRAALQLGVATGVVTLAYAGAIARLPLGTASALEFIGPLAVALAALNGVGLPVVAAAGVLALTEPWAGAVDAVGVVLALVAAAAWAAYILLTKRLGALLPGMTGLALSLAAAAVVTTPIGLTQAAPGLDWTPVLQIAGIAVLVPLLPFAFEYLALRKLSAGVFGILMCLEPGLGLLVGMVVLEQAPRVLAVVGLLLVVAAGVVATAPRFSKTPAAGPICLDSAV